VTFLGKGKKIKYHGPTWSTDRPFKQAAINMFPFNIGMDNNYT